MEQGCSLSAPVFQSHWLPGKPDEAFHKEPVQTLLLLLKSTTKSKTIVRARERDKETDRQMCVCTRCAFVFLDAAFLFSFKGQDLRCCFVSTLHLTTRPEEKKGQDDAGDLMPDEALLSRMAVDLGKDTVGLSSAGTDCAHRDNYRPLGRAVLTWGAG